MTKYDQKGNIIIEDNRATITFTRFLKHPPHRVWEAITNPEEFNKWYNGQSIIDGKVGGIFEIRSGPSFHWKGRIILWEPPKVFEYEHNHKPRKEIPTGVHTIVRWELTPTTNGTILQFTQRRLKSNFGYAPAMHAFLDRLDAYLNHQPLPDFIGRFREVIPLYPVWRANE